MIINNLEWALSIVRPKRVRVDPALLHLVEKAVNYPAIRAIQAYASFQARDRAAAGHGLWPDRNCCRNRPTATVNIPLKFWIEPVTFLTSTTSPVFRPWVCEVVTETVLLFRETDAICTLPTRTPAGRGLDDSKTMHWLPL